MVGLICFSFTVFSPSMHWVITLRRKSVPVVLTSMSDSDWQAPLKSRSTEGQALSCGRSTAQLLPNTAGSSVRMPKTHSHGTQHICTDCQTQIKMHLCHTIEICTKAHKSNNFLLSLHICIQHIKQRHFTCLFSFSELILTPLDKSNKGEPSSYYWSSEEGFLLLPTIQTQTITSPLSFHSGLSRSHRYYNWPESVLSV